MKIFRIFIASALVANANFCIAQTSTTCSMYLLYTISTGETTALSSSFYSGKFFPDFTKDDYASVLDISKQRIWKRTSAGDTIRNYDFNYGVGSFFVPDRSVYSVRNLNAKDFENDATVIGPHWPEDYYRMNAEGNALIAVKPLNYFQIHNGFAEDGNHRMKMGNDLRIIISTDSQMVSDKKGKQQLKVVTNYLDPANLALSFEEKWSFDPLTGIFQKQVNDVGYLRMIQDPSTGEKIGYSPFLNLDNPNGIYNPKVDLPLKKNVVIEESVQSAELKLRYDSMEKNSTPEDVIERMQYAAGNASSFDRVKFLSALFYYAFQNPKNVFPEKNNVVDAAHPYPTKDSLTGVFHSVDMTNEIEDPMNPGKFLLAPITFDVMIQNIYSIRFYEDWYYDPNTFTIQKKVNGIGFELMEYDMNNFPHFKDAGIYIKVN